MYEFDHLAKKIVCIQSLHDFIDFMFNSGFNFTYSFIDGVEDISCSEKCLDLYISEFESRCNKEDLL